MAITMSLDEVVRASAVLAELGTQRLFGCAKVVSHLARLTKLVSVEAGYFHKQEQRYIRELGVERDPTPAEQQTGAVKMISVTEANQTEFQQRMTALGAESVEIAWPPLGLDALDVLTISAQDLLALGPLIADTEPS